MTQLVFWPVIKPLLAEGFSSIPDEVVEVLVGDVEHASA